MPRSSRLARVLATLLAALLTILGLGQPTTAAAAMPEAVATVTYDTDYHGGFAVRAATERGPPDVGTTTTTPTAPAANDVRSTTLVARSSTTHDEPSLVLAPTAQAGRTSGKPGGLLCGEPLSPDWWKVAANNSTQPYEVGRHNDLKARSQPNDGLNIHHVPQRQHAGQAIRDYVYGTGLGIALPFAEHRQIPYLRGPYSGSADDLFERDIQNLRDYTNTPEDSIDELRSNFDDWFTRWWAQVQRGLGG